MTKESVRIFKNFHKFSKIQYIKTSDLIDGVQLRGASRHDVSNIKNLRKEIDGIKHSWGIIFLLKIIPEKCCFVVENSNGYIEAFAIYYFNERDFKDGTVHEGFIGVKPGCTGKGIATKIRWAAIDHFSQSNCIQGISSRISLSNKASILSGEKVGYQVVETYRDGSSGEMRGYFYRNFKIVPGNDE